MFRIDPSKIIEDFMRTNTADKIIADVIGSKITIDIARNGNIAHFNMYYGKYKISECSIDLTPGSE